MELDVKESLDDADTHSLQPSSQLTASISSLM